MNINEIAKTRCFKNACTVPGMSPGFAALHLADGTSVGAVSYAVPGRVTGAYPRAVLADVETVVWLTGAGLTAGGDGTSGLALQSTALLGASAMGGSGAYALASSLAGARVPSSPLDEISYPAVEGADGLVGADRVEVSGSGFAAAHPPSCRFGAVRVIAQWTSAEQVWCAAPSTGPADVSFAVTQGAQHQVSGMYTYAHEADVRVQWATPARVPASGGATVVVHGAGVRSSRGISRRRLCRSDRRDAERKGDGRGPGWRRS